MAIVSRRTDEDPREEVPLEANTVVAVEAEVSEDVCQEFTAEPLAIRRFPFLGVRRRHLGGPAGAARPSIGVRTCTTTRLKYPICCSFSRPPRRFSVWRCLDER